MADRPLVAVCLSPADLYPEVDDLSGAVVCDTRRLELSAADAAALEHGLRAAEVWDATVVAVAAGGPEVDPLLREVAALGVEVLRVETGGHGGPPGRRALQPHQLAGEPSGLASALAGAIRSRKAPCLVVCGYASAAQGTGAVPALLAHHLGVAQILGMVSLRAGQRPGAISGERRLDRGWRETVEVSGPAVVSVEAAGVQLRRASLPSALAATALTVPVWKPPSHTTFAVKLGPPRPYRPRTRPVPAPSGGTRDRLLALTGALDSREPARIVGPLGAAEAADELLAYLRRNGYLETD